MRAEYFPGCHDVSLGLDLEPLASLVGPLTATPNVSLADAVCAAEQRPCYCRDCDNARLLAQSKLDGQQQCLPAELMPIPAGQLFA